FLPTLGRDSSSCRACILRTFLPAGRTLSFRCVRRNYLAGSNQMTNGLPDLACFRKNKGLTLQEIAQQTKISIRYLEAIEDGRTSCLPGGVYNNSYLRQYARAIDYDENELLASYSTAGLIDNQATQPDWRVALRTWTAHRR